MARHIGNPIRKSQDWCNQELAVTGSVLAWGGSGFVERPGFHFRGSGAKAPLLLGVSLMDEIGPKQFDGVPPPPVFFP